MHTLFEQQIYELFLELTAFTLFEISVSDNGSFIS